MFRWPAQQGAVNIVASCRMRFVITDMFSGIPPARGTSGAGLDSFVAFLAR
ncbi:MAG: hypothetical protein WA081_01350 [Desulfosalsimonadaceae bacterium]